MLHWLDAPCLLVSGTSFRVWSSFHVLYVTLFVNTPRSNWFVQSTYALYIEMYLGVCSFLEKYVLTLQCIHIAWKWTYIMVIGICHSRTSRTWQYLISNQALYECTFNTDFLFDNMYWNAVAFTKEICCHASGVYWIH